MSWTSPLHADLSPWPTADQGSWASTTWVAQSFPSLLCRARAVFRQVGQASSPEDADAIERDLLPLLSNRPGAGAFELSALREHVGRLRRARPGAGLERLELTMVALDATNRFLAGNPFVQAVEAMEWQRVPPEHAGFAIELGLLARQWRIGQNDVPEVEGPQRVAGLGRVVAIAQRVAGVTGDLDWPRELHRASHKLGARWMGGGFTYLFEMLERLPQTEPRNLAIYEALADEASADLRLSVEQAIAVFVESLGSPRLAASAALRAAIRRVVGGDEEGAFERGKQAFERMVAVDDPYGTCCAAVLLGSLLEHDAGARAQWLEHALAWARGRETARLQLELLGILGLERRDAGDELGMRRILEEARTLAAADPEAWEGLAARLEGADEPAEDELGAPEHEPAEDELDEPEREDAGLPPELARIGRELERGSLMAAYEALGAYIGELLESHDHDAVVHMLLGHIARLGDLARRPTPVDARDILDELDEPAFMRAVLAEQRSIALDLLRAWLCAAVTELVEDDHELWCASKALQLELEDRLGVTEELVMAGAEPDPLPGSPLFLLLRQELEPDERSSFDPRARALQCIDEAKRAMQQGRSQRARFWVDRAQRYRARMDEA